MTGKNVRGAETEFTSSVLHSNTNAYTVVEGFWERKPAQCRKRSSNFFQWKLDRLVYLVQILCTYIFYRNVDIVSLFFNNHQQFSFT